MVDSRATEGRAPGNDGDDGDDVDCCGGLRKLGQKLTNM